MRIVVFGPPGGGKGTQVERIKRDAGAVAIAPGDLLRQAVAAGSPIGQRAQEYMRRGQLVPDALVIDLVRERMQRPDVRQGYILDGFPRTLAQLDAAESFLGAAGLAPEVWLFINVPESVIEERILGRRTCTACQASWHVRFNPSPLGDRCGRCGGELGRRPDDDPEKFRTRLEAYRRDTVPVIDRLRRQERLVTVEAGSLGPDAVEQLVRRAVGLLAPRRKLGRANVPAWR